MSIPPDSHSRRKAIFDVVRTMLGRGFRRTEIAALDRAIDAGSGLRDDDAQGQPGRRIGPDGVALIKQFEGCARKRPDGLFEAYPDPATGAAPWTIGWGATGAGIAPGVCWTQEECDARLANDLAGYADEVSDALGAAPTTQSQFDALVSFHYNTGAIRRATLTHKHILGDFAGATGEYSRWVYANGIAMRGLKRRRRAEARLYERGRSA